MVSHCEKYRESRPRPFENKSTLLKGWTALAIFCFALSSTVAQSVISYKKGVFIEHEQVAYGQVIILNGESEEDVDFVEVECIVLPEVKTYKAEKSSGKKWFVKIGPFPIKANVVITVREIVKLDKKKQNQILVLFNGYIDDLKNKGSFSDDELKDGLYSKLQVSGYMKNYKDRNGKPSDSLFREKIDLALINKYNEGDKLLRTNLIKAIQKDTASALAKELQTNEKEILAKLANPTDSLKQIISTSSKVNLDIVENLLEDFIKKYNRYNEGLIGINKIPDDVFITTSNTTTFSTALDVSGLQAYIGVDLGLIKYDTVTSVFVTLHPYLKKTDPDKDYKLCGNLWHFLTPSLGMGIGKNVNTIKPVYFVGVGFRLNKVFRLAAGATYYKPKKDVYDNWNFGVSASININYVADLLRLITAAQSQAK